MHRRPAVNALLMAHAMLRHNRNLQAGYAPSTATALCISTPYTGRSATDGTPGMQWYEVLFSEINVRALLQVN